MTTLYTLVLRAVHDGLGTARDHELVVPSVFGSEMVGSQTLLPVLRARVSAEAPRTAHDVAREVWESAWGGLAPEIDPSYAALIAEFLASIVDFPPGAEVGFAPAHATAR